MTPGTISEPFTDRSVQSTRIVHYLARAHAQADTRLCAVRALGDRRQETGVVLLKSSNPLKSVVVKCFGCVAKSTHFCNASEARR